MKLKIFTVVIVSIIALAFPVNFVFAHGGEDHGDAPHEVQAVITDSGTTKLLTGTNIEVLIKYPELKLKEVIPVQVFVTDFKTNKPLEKLDVDLVFKGPGKTIEVNAKPTTTQGLYQASLNFATAGSYDLSLNVAGNKSPGTGPLLVLTPGQSPEPKEFGSNPEAEPRGILNTNKIDEQLSASGFEIKNISSVEAVTNNSWLIPFLEILLGLLLILAIYLFVSGPKIYEGKTI